MFNRPDIRRNESMLTGAFARKGYDWWWHSLTAINHETGEEKPFFIEFFTCNPALGGDEAILGQLPENQEEGRRPSYLMVKAGCWGEPHMQLHRFIPWNEVEMKSGSPFSIKAHDCYCSNTVIKGSVSVSEEDAAAHPEWMSDAGEITFNLVADKKISYNVGYGASTPLRTLQAFEMFWHVEGMKTEYTGTITLNGTVYDVTPATSFGYADKNWGRNFTSPWLWLSSCDMVSNLTGKRLENSAFDVGGGKPKVYFVPLNRKLLGCIYYEGEQYEFNFSKPWLRSNTLFKSYETETQVIWDLRQENSDVVMETHITCEKKDMLLINYESPDGQKRHNKLWNGGNGKGNIKLYRKTNGGLRLLDDISIGHIGCEYGEYC